MTDISPQLKWNRANREAIRAHGIVARAIKRGELQREPCVICGAANAQAHHSDYSKPLAVEFYCHYHHRRLHDRGPGDLFARVA